MEIVYVFLYFCIFISGFFLSYFVGSTKLDLKTRSERNFFIFIIFSFIFYIFLCGILIYLLSSNEWSENEYINKYIYEPIKLSPGIKNLAPAA